MTPPLPKFNRTRLPGLVGDMRQLASVRQVVLQDGAEAGQRALVFSTGGGLDFWVLQDRSMDVGLLQWRGMPVAWLHPAGFRAPSLHNPHDAGGTGVENSLGGFMVTCGLDNVRQPRDGMPLHGTLPYTPARLLSCGEDWGASTPCLFAEAEMTAAHLGRHALRLTRRIEAPIAQGRLTVTDRVENIGPAPAEMRILYHVNFGFPAVGDGTRVALNGQGLEIREDEPRAVCHSSGTSAEFRAELQRPPDGPWPGFSARISGETAALPHFQLWRDARPRRNVLALEPVNCDRNPDGTSGPGTMLEPGQTWDSRLTFDFDPSPKPQSH